MAAERSSAADVVAALDRLQSDAELIKVRKRLAPDEEAIGVRMGKLFEVAKAHTGVHNAVGIFLKHAGTADPDSLHRFLAEHAASMPRPALRLAVEKLDPTDRSRYLS